MGFRDELSQRHSDAVRTVTLAHGETRLAVDGPDQGEVVLFVHGMTYPLEVFGPLAAAVAASGRQAIRFDLYGRGFSTWDGTPLTLAALAAQAHAVLEQVRPGASAHIVGLSNADLVLNAFSLRWPQRTRSLTWIAPGGIDTRTMNWTMRTTGRLPLAAAILGSRLRRRCVERMLRHLDHLPDDAPEQAASAYETAIHTVRTNPHFAGAIASYLAALPRPVEAIAAAEDVSQQGTPVLMLTFAEEADTTEENTAPFQRVMPSLSAITLPQGTHMALLERPASIIPHLLAFLDAPSVGLTPPSSAPG